MEFKIERGAFQKALEISAGIADKKNAALTIVASVLIKTDGKQKLMFGATDLSVTSQISMPATVTSEGACCVTAKDLLDIVRNMPGDTVTLSTMDNHWIEVKSGKSKFKLVGLDPSNFPKLPSVAEAKLFKLDSAIFREMIKKIAFSIGVDQHKPHLTSANFICKDGRATLVSTDSHRLSRVSRDLPDGPTFPDGILIPRKALNEIASLIATRESPSYVGVTAKNEVFVLKADEAPVTGASVTLAAKIIDGQFPPWEQVIPKKQERKIQIGRNDLNSAIARVQLMCSDGQRGIVWNLKAGLLTLSADNADRGNAVEEMEVDYKGTTLAICLNGRYTQDILGAIDTKEVTIELGGEIDPAVIRPLDSGDYDGVIMPMRL